MLKGQCPKCNSETVYKEKNGITDDFGLIFVKVGTANVRTEKITYACASCGHYEDYLADKTLCEKIAQNWTKV